MMITTLVLAATLAFSPEVPRAVIEDSIELPTDQAVETLLEKVEDASFREQLRDLGSLFAGDLEEDFFATQNGMSSETRLEALRLFLVHRNEETAYYLLVISHADRTTALGRSIEALLQPEPRAFYNPARWWYGRDKDFVAYKPYPVAAQLTTIVDSSQVAHRLTKVYPAVRDISDLTRAIRDKYLGKEMVKRATPAPIHPREVGSIR